jgi:glycosyltransferase involved in cell wall biosynthesis
MTSENPLVSVIIPVYNGARYLRAALESVFAQTYRNFEVIVVDDGSVDDSGVIAQSFPEVRYIHQTNQGVAAARNHAIEVARGEYFAFLDQDDLWTADKLKLQIEYLLNHPEVGYTLTQQKFFLEPGATLPAWFRKELLDSVHTGWVLGTLVVRRTVFETVGIFATDYSAANDSDWFFRAKAAAIPMAVVPELLLLKRIHEANDSARAKEILAELLKVVRTSLDQKRNHGLNGPVPDPVRLISVIIPVYNYARYLAEAVESVLNQTYRNVEVIVVDDGSTDQSGEVAKSFAGRGVRYCHQVHAGIGPARNKGVELARGEFIAFLDADDRWPVEKLERQLKEFEADPELEMVFGQALQLQNGPTWESGINEENPQGLVPGMVPGTMLIKRDAFTRVGKFKGDLKVGEFIDWYARAVELKVRSLVMPDLFLWRRIHDSNQGVRERQSVTDYARVLKAKLDRQRAEGR